MDKKTRHKSTINHKPIFTEVLQDYTVMKSDDDIIYNLCKHITLGGYSYGFCEYFNINYLSLSDVISKNTEYKKAVNMSKLARTEYVKEKVSGLLMDIATQDITEAYSEDLDLKDVESLPKNVRRLISNIKKSDSGVEVKFQDRIKALDMLSKQFGMYTQKIELKADDSLLSLLSSKEK